MKGQEDFELLTQRQRTEIASLREQVRVFSEEAYRAGYAAGNAAARAVLVERKGAR